MGGRLPPRVVFPFNPAGNYNNPFSAGALELARNAVTKHAPNVEMVDLGERHDAYYTLLRQLWEDGEAFLIVEQDVEIHADVIPDLEACAGEWCGYLYGAPGNKPDEPLFMEAALGCTRFSSSLLERFPSFMAELPVRDWRRLDCEIKPRLLTLEVAWCAHTPAVAHHHEYPSVGCACGRSHDE